MAALTDSSALSMEILADMFELDLPTVHSIISKMIINEELMVRAAGAARDGARPVGAELDPAPLSVGVSRPTDADGDDAPDGTDGAAEPGPAVGRKIGEPGGEQRARLRPQARLLRGILPRSAPRPRTTPSRPAPAPRPDASPLFSTPQIKKTATGKETAATCAAAATVNRSAAPTTEPRPATPLPRPLPNNNKNKIK